MVAGREWVAVGGRDAQGPGLFKIPVDGGPPVRLVAGVAVNPVWSPDGQMIVYAGQSAISPLLAVRPDGAAVELPTVTIRSGRGGGYRFLPSGRGLVYLRARHEPDFWLLDFATKQSRQLTRCSNKAPCGRSTSHLTGSHIVFDRLRENSDIVLIDLPK